MIVHTIATTSWQCDTCRTPMAAGTHAITSGGQTWCEDCVNRALHGRAWFILGVARARISRWLR